MKTISYSRRMKHLIKSIQRSTNSQMELDNFCAITGLKFYSISDIKHFLKSGLRFKKVFRVARKAKKMGYYARAYDFRYNNSDFRNVPFLRIAKIIIEREEEVILRDGIEKCTANFLAFPIKIVPL